MASSTRKDSKEQEEDLSNKSNQASYFFNQGDYVQAEKLHRDVLEGRKRVLGPDDTSTLHTMNKLARTYRRLHRYDEAKNISRDALERQERTLGLDHDDTLRTAHNLAATLNHLQRYDESEKICSNVLERRIRVLGPDHSETLQTMHALAVTLHHLQRYDEAEKMYRDALERQERTLGPNHIDTLRTAHNLAFTLNYLQLHDDSEKICSDVLQRRVRVLGPNHTETLHTMHALAVTLNHLQRYDEAEKIYSDVLERQIRVLGPDHINTLQTMHNLALAFQALQRYDEAEKIRRDALERQERILGSDHVDTLRTTHNLAITLQDLQRYDEAEKFYRDVLERRIRVLGTNHIDTLKTIHNLARLLDHLQQYDEAERLGRIALEGRIQALGPNHEGTISTARLLAAIQDRGYFNFDSLYETLCKDTQATFQSSMSQPRDWTPWIKKEGLIASGGNGDVYITTWKAIPTPVLVPPRVVIKTVRCAGVRGSKYLKLLKREVAILAGTKHQNVVPFVGICLDEGSRPALVSLYMENGDVRAYLDTYPDVNRASINLDISCGLEYLHNHAWKIVHGDLKAANVLINSKGQACLTDFGLSLIVADDSLWTTSAAEARGTTRWMAPELLNGNQLKVHMPSDVYAFAMTSLEVVTGKVPFAHLQLPGTIVTAVVLRGERPSRPKDPPISDATWHLWQECWTDNPARRPVMSEVVSRLKRWM